ncbi:MAG: hypothetical protein HZB13_08690 [Acidobacteria bacterium]|nr:hypothetical protein [Acidobacteriota bacterium]
MTTDKWVAIMTAAGFSKQQMNRWHVEFERQEPAEHQKFLEYLGIDQAEIAQIRLDCRKDQATS